MTLCLSVSLCLRLSQKSKFYRYGLTNRAGLLSPILQCVTKNSDASKNNSELGLESWGSIYKISYDLSYDYRKFIV